MPDIYLVKLTSQAEIQLKNLIQYIALELKVPDTALFVLDELETAIFSLSRFPHRIPLTDEQPWKDYGIRKMPVKNHLVYFWIDEKHAKVQITAIIHEKQDQIKQLSNMSLY